MEYTTLGGTGVSVSEIGLGCNTLGLDTSEKWDWTVSEAESKALVHRAVELGINFFDTANTYSWGDSERVLGDALAEYDRDELVVASKVYNDPTADAHPNASGLSRKTIDQELDNSLDRLGMDYLDLYQIHRWDESTPIDVTVRALTDAVRRGDVEYLGASSMWTHQFAGALRAGEAAGVEPFATMSNHYNLAYREEDAWSSPPARPRTRSPRRSRSRSNRSRPALSRVRETRRTGVFHVEMPVPEGPRGHGPHTLMRDDSVGTLLPPGAGEKRRVGQCSTRSSYTTAPQAR